MVAKGRRSWPLALTPLQQAIVLVLRRHGCTFQQIGLKVELTPAGVYLYAKRAQQRAVKLNDQQDAKIAKQEGQKGRTVTAFYYAPTQAYKRYGGVRRMA